MPISIVFNHLTQLFNWSCHHSFLACYATKRVSLMQKFRSFKNRSTSWPQTYCRGFAYPQLWRLCEFCANEERDEDFRRHCLSRRRRCIGLLGRSFIPPLSRSKECGSTKPIVSCPIERYQDGGWVFLHKTVRGVVVFSHVVWMFNILCERLKFLFTSVSHFHLPIRKSSV